MSPLFGGITLPGRPDLQNVRKLDLLPARAILEMMNYGFAIDLDHLAKVSRQLSVEMDELRAEICSTIPEHKLDEFIARSGLDSEDEAEDGWLPMNVDSNKQLASLLFEVLGIGNGKRLKRTKGGEQISTGRRQLEQLRLEHPVVGKTLAYRERAKLKNTYTDALPTMARVHPEGRCWCGLNHRVRTHRVHTQLLSTRTATGRYASKSPNLQNVSIRSKHGADIRCAFVASPGTELVSCDFSQVELRMLAFIANVSEMVEVFKKGRDIHTDTAMRAFDITEEDVSADKVRYRNPSKNVNFAVCVSRGQRVLTDRGLIPIELIEHCDRIWDGLEFVTHSGVIYKGIRRVITYDGITATPEHKVWIQDGTETTLAEAMAEGYKLAVTGCEGQPILFNTGMLRYHREEVRPQTYKSVVREMFGRVLGLVGQLVGGKVKGAWVRTTEVSRRPAFCGIGRTVLCYCATMLESKVAKLVKLRGARNKEYVPQHISFYPIYPVELAPSFLPRGGHWPEEQRRALSSWQFAAGIAHEELKQYQKECPSKVQGEDLHSNTTTFYFKEGLPKFRTDAREDEGAVINGSGVEGRTRESTEKALETEAEVYDILNAGPRHRFTVEGRLVSNCYGETAQGLYEQLVADSYGKAGVEVPEWLTLDWCESFLRKWFKLYPEVKEYMDNQKYRAVRYGYVWDLFGRVRRIPQVKSVHERVAAKGFREGGNMPIQGTAAELMKLAIAEVQDWIEREVRPSGVWCQPLLTVHDEGIWEVEEGWGECFKEVVEGVFAGVLTDKQSGVEYCTVPVLAEGKCSERWEK